LNIWENTLEFAKKQDELDPLKDYRNQFHLPTFHKNKVTYFTGNSLGLQPKATKSFINQELNDWAKWGVEGHFHAERPWMPYHEFITEKAAKIVEPYLNKIMDIERLHRRISLGILQPADFSGLDIAYTSIQDIFKLTHIFSGYLKQILPTNDNLILFDKFIEEYKNLFNLEEISKYHLNNINNSFFNEGQIEEIDEIQLKIGKYKTSLKDICSKLSYYIDRDNEVVRLEYNDREGHYLQTTKKRGETLKKSFANMGWKEIKAGNIKIDPKELELKFMKDKMKITSDKINNLSYKLRKTQEEIKSKTTKVYLEKLEYFWKQYGGTFQSISDFISKLDFYKSNAKTSILYGYNKPIIKEDEQSYIDVKDLRHPIIERIQTDTEYVPNDICIGKSGEISESGESCDMDKLNGMLLYGCNAVGKSSLMKAVGLNIIMAQAGMYVASSEFIFNP